MHPPMLDTLHGIEVFPSSDCLSFTPLSISISIYLSISHNYFSILKPPCILTLYILTLHPPFPLSCFYLYLYLYLVQGVSPIGSGAGSQDVRVQVQVMGWVRLFLPRLAFMPPLLCVMFLPRLAFMPPLLCVMSCHVISYYLLWASAPTPLPLYFLYSYWSSFSYEFHDRIKYFESLLHSKDFY